PPKRAGRQPVVAGAPPAWLFAEAARVATDEAVQVLARIHGRSPSLGQGLRSPMAPVPPR
ncbi:unnamed protein product, partial [Polarella glacialis]